MAKFLFYMDCPECEGWDASDTPHHDCTGGTNYLTIEHECLGCAVKDYAERYFTAEMINAEDHLLVWVEIDGGKPTWVAVGAVPKIEFTVIDADETARDYCAPEEKAHGHN